MTIDMTGLVGRVAQKEVNYEKNLSLLLSRPLESFHSESRQEVLFR